MRLNLRYFASVREKLGLGQEALTFPSSVITAGDARDWLRGRDAQWSEALDPKRAVRMAYDQVMCDESQPLAEGGELAFFPPVTGG